MTKLLNSQKTIKNTLCTSLIAIVIATLSSNTYAKPDQDRPSFIDTLTSEQRQAYEGFQNNADIVRLRQMEYWVELIEEYHDKTGKYPLQGQTNNRLVVFVATPRQQDYTYELPGLDHASMATFVSTLEQGLGRTIEEYYDPQYAPDAKPNYYIYMLDGNDYFFAVHTHQNYPFSRQVAPDYNKVEVSNSYSQRTPYIMTPKMLFKSEAYQQAVAQPPERPGFFAKRGLLTLHATKE